MSMPMRTAVPARQRRAVLPAKLRTVPVTLHLRGDDLAVLDWYVRQPARYGIHPSTVAELLEEIAMDVAEGICAERLHAQERRR